MDTLKDALEYIAKEWAVIESAPLIFSTAIILIGGAIWLGTRAFFRGRIDNAHDRERTLETHVGLLREQFENEKTERGRIEASLTEVREAAPNIADPETREIIFSSSAGAARALDGLSATGDLIGDIFRNIENPDNEGN